MCPLELIPVDIQGTMKDTKNIDVALILDEVRNTIVPIKQNANVAQ
jgi:hypothetical protein